MTKMVELEIALEEHEWANVSASAKRMGMSSIDEYFRYAIDLMMEREKPTDGNERVFRT